MRIDCEKWTLQFWVQRANTTEFLQVTDAFPITENITYHPVVTHGDTRCRYMHILPDDCACEMKEIEHSCDTPSGKTSEFQHVSEKAE